MLMVRQIIYIFVIIALGIVFVFGGENFASAVQPKPLSENVKRGLAWLIQHQHENGGWAQGEESAQMGNALEHLKDKPNVAESCMVLLTLIRSGSTPKDGPYAENIRRGLNFIISEIEASDEHSLYITSIRASRVQQKIGTYIDTFLTAMILAEVKDQMPDEQSRNRIIAALDKVMDKIESNQLADGTWANEGWATDLSQNIATKSLNRAAQQGYAVDEKVRERAESYARQQYDRDKGSFKVGEGSAGVELYASGAAVSSMQESVVVNEAKKQEIRRKLKDAKTDKERQEAEDTLARFEQAERDLDDARKAIIGRLQDEQFIAGFGSNGGEEFLSYLNIGESLFTAGDKDWEEWDKSITANLSRIQNNDGSWTGHHCITGRTFCTSAALLVLMIDRSPVPISSKIRQ
jgi:hypothetical protein